MTPHAIAALMILAVSAAAAQTPGQTSGGDRDGAMTLYPPGELVWRPGPPSLPKGVQMVVLEGDPSLAGVFTMRLRFPDGFQVFPHSHTQVEHATVLAGVLHLGMGPRFDRAATRPGGSGAGATTPVSCQIAMPSMSASRTRPRFTGSSLP